MNKYRATLKKVMDMVHLSRVTHKFLVVETDDVARTADHIRRWVPTKCIMGARDHLREYPTRDYPYLLHVMEQGSALVVLADEPGWTSDPSIAIQLAPYTEQGIICTLIWHHHEDYM